MAMRSAGETSASAIHWPHGGVGAYALQQLAVAVEHRGVGRTEFALHLVEAHDAGGKRKRRLHAGRHDQCSGKRAAAAGNEWRAMHEGFEGGADIDGVAAPFSAMRPRELHLLRDGRAAASLGKKLPPKFTAQFHIR